MNDQRDAWEKKMKHLFLGAVIFLMPFVVNAGTDEMSLFNSDGVPVAYIAFDDGKTIYLWEGEPVGYLKRIDEGGHHVYGFNGKHLGWFSGGLIYDHQGNMACADKKTLARTDYEPYKPYKQFKPYKSYKEYPPSRPRLLALFGETPCGLLLADGKD